MRPSRPRKVSSWLTVLSRRKKTNNNNSARWVLHVMFSKWAIQVGSLSRVKGLRRMSRLGNHTNLRGTRISQLGRQVNHFRTKTLLHPSYNLNTYRLQVVLRWSLELVSLASLLEINLFRITMYTNSQKTKTFFPSSHLLTTRSRPRAGSLSHLRILGTQTFNQRGRKMEAISPRKVVILPTTWILVPPSTLKSSR